jgi:hypothetical protein
VYNVLCLVGSAQCFCKVKALATTHCSTEIGTAWFLQVQSTSLVKLHNYILFVVYHDASISIFVALVSFFIL